MTQGTDRAVSPESLDSEPDGTDANPTATERDDDRRARAMKDGLQKDVAAWSAARSGAATRAADDFGVAKPPAPAPVRRPRQAKPAAEAKPVPKSNKPFRMSYGGETTSQHIAARLARGAR
jgi:hypothetical protein